MGTNKKTGKKALKAEKLRAKRLQLLAVSACPPEGCKSKCCEKYTNCESKRCRKCPCLDLIKSLKQNQQLVQVA